MCVFESRYINTLIFENIFKISGLFIHTCFILWRATLSSSLWANIKFGSSPWLEVKRFRVTLCLFTSLSRILFSSVKSWNKNKEWMQCRKMWNWLALKNISWKQFDGNFCERLYCAQWGKMKIYSHKRNISSDQLISKKLVSRNNFYIEYRVLIFYGKSISIKDTLFDFT